MIQYKLIFQLENGVLPRTFDKTIVSFLKASVQNYSQELFESLYSKTHSVIKKYTFSKYLCSPVFHKDEIRVSENEFCLYFSDVDFAESLHFFNAFRKMKNVRYPMKNNTMTLSGVYLQNQKDITESEIIVKMLSPIVARKHDITTNKDQYFVFSDDGFSKVLQGNTKFFLNKLDIGLNTDDFQVIPVKAKKVVLNSYGEQMIDASLGVFKLNGNPKLLNILYAAGIGARRGECCGKFAVIG